MNDRDNSVNHEIPSATFAITSNRKIIIGVRYSYYNFILLIAGIFKKLYSQQALKK